MRNTGCLVLAGMLGCLPVSARADTNPLELFRAMTIPGGFTAGAVCIGDNGVQGPGGGSIEITGIPAGATVLEAWLWYTVLDPAPPVGGGTPTLDGVALSPVFRGESDRNPCFSSQWTGVFRADVSGIVTSNGTYTLAGFPGGASTAGLFTEGASIAVVYCRPDLPVQDLVLFDGVDVLLPGASSFHSQELDGFMASGAPVEASWLAVVGNGQTTDVIDDDDLSLNGILLETLVPTTEVLSGGACPLPLQAGFWDLGLYDVSQLVPPGSTSASVGLSVTSDCYSVAAYVLATSSDGQPQVCPQLAVRFGPVSARRTPAGVRLRWTTLSEEASFGFEIEARDAAGAVWRLPLLLHAAGAGSQYEHLDTSEAARSGRTVAYRVLERSFDGAGDASEWVQVTESTSGRRVRTLQRR